MILALFTTDNLFPTVDLEEENLCLVEPMFTSDIVDVLLDCLITDAYLQHWLT